MNKRVSTCYSVILVVTILSSIAIAPTSVSSVAGTNVQEDTWVFLDLYFINLTSIINGTEYTEYRGIDISDFEKPSNVTYKISDVFEQTISYPTLNTSGTPGEYEVYNVSRTSSFVNISIYDNQTKLQDLTVSTEFWEFVSVQGPTLNFLSWQDGSQFIAALGTDEVSKLFGNLNETSSVLQLFGQNTPIPETNDFSEPFIPITSLKNLTSVLSNDAKNVENADDLIQNSETYAIADYYFGTPSALFTHDNLTKIIETLDAGVEFANRSNYKNIFSDTSTIAPYINLTKNEVKFNYSEEAGKFTVSYSSEFEYEFDENNQFGQNKLYESVKPRYSFFNKYTLIVNANTGLVEHYSSDTIVDAAMGETGDISSRYDRFAFAYNTSLTTNPIIPTPTSTTSSTSSSDTSPPTSTAPNSTSPTAPAPGGTTTLIIILLVLVVVITGIAGAIFYFVKKKKGK